MTLAVKSIDRTEQAALALFDLHQRIEVLNEEFKTRKAEFAEMIGEGNTYQLPGLGKIQVTAGTQTRGSGKIEPQFEVSAYLALTPTEQAKLQKAGVVVLVEKMIKGMAPVVKIFRD